MKTTILQNNFAKGLSQVSRIVGGRTTLPVLSNILISAKKGLITLSSTDLEVGVTARVTGKVEEEGSITLPARLLVDFITNNTDETIVLSSTDLKVNLKSDHYEANIAGISAEEFPTIPEPPAEALSLIKRDDFIDAVRKTLIAPAHDETRPTLAGIHFQFSGKTVVLAATDSYRLAEKKLTLESEVAERKIIVPVRTMSEVLRLAIAGNEENIKISSTENQVFFIIGETMLVSRLIEGAFPNYSQIIPQSSSVVVTIQEKELANALKMAALFAKDAANNIRLKVGNKELTIMSALTQSGDSTSRLAAQTSGGEMEISFNARYLLDVLQVTSSPNVIIKLNDGNSAGLLQFENDKDYLYIVMPLKIEG